jgi:hypothetical protein
VKFTNDAKPITLDSYRLERDKSPQWQGGSYGYDRPSKYLFQWSRLLQNVLSQVLTKTFGAGYHTQSPAIYKCEGGLNIPGAGELVLHSQYCSWDGYYGPRVAKADAGFAAEVITQVVLGWNPMDPVQSLITIALEATGIKEKGVNKNEDKELAEHLIANGKKYGQIWAVFGGNALADFFDWNPFSKAPIDRPYERWCLTHSVYSSQEPQMTDAEVDQMWADEDKTDELREFINAASEKKHGQFHSRRVIGIKHERKDDQVRYYINMGHSHYKLQGWHDEKEIRDLVAAGEV